MSFTDAEALTRIFPFLARLVLPRAVIDFARIIPATDINLIAAANVVLVRKDIHPALIDLLAQTIMETHGKPGIFQQAGEFPKLTDPEYPIAESARDFYKNGPSFLNRYLPFWMTNSAQRILAVLAAAIAIVLPLFHYLPMLYKWNMRRRLLYWYDQLKVLEASIDANPSDEHLMESRSRSNASRMPSAASGFRWPSPTSSTTFEATSTSFGAGSRPARAHRCGWRPNREPVNAAIGRRNTTRSRAYFAARCKATRPMPTASVAIRIRSGFMPCRGAETVALGADAIGGGDDHAVEETSRCSRRRGAHNVPSLSNTATRSGTGTKSGEPCLVTRSTKATIAFLGTVSFQDGSGRLRECRPGARHHYGCEHDSYDGRHCCHCELDRITGEAAARPPAPPLYRCGRPRYGRPHVRRRRSKPISAPPSASA